MKSPPRPSAFQLLSMLPVFIRDRPGAIKQIFDQYGELVHVAIPKHPFYLVSQPSHVHHILHRNSKNYQKSFDWKIVSSFLGDGLITTQGEKWRRGRKLAQPFFHRERVQALSSIIFQVTNEFTNRWEQTAAEEPFDVFRNTFELSLEIMGRALFGESLAQYTEAIGRTITFCLQHLERRVSSPIDFAAFMNTPDRARFNKMKAEIDAIIDEIIRKSQTHPDSLISILSNSDEKGIHLTSDQLRSHVLTYLIAGHETTGVALAWSLYLLAKHPEVQSELYFENQRVYTDHTLPPIERLPLHRQVLLESMRLYPPVWSIGRESISTDHLGEYTIPAQSTLLISPYLIHRNPNYWENPDEFKPERFEAFEKNPLPKGAFIPFSMGARHCIGEGFAMLEAQLVLAMLVRHFKFELLNDTTPELEALMSLRPRRPIFLNLELR